MAYQVLEKRQIASGKWQVRVALSDGESAFLSFPYNPSPERIDAEAEILVLNQRIAALRGRAIEQEQQQPASTRITRLEYMNRFTDAELGRIYAAAKQSVEVEVWLEKFKQATEIDLADPRTVSGLQALAAGGLIGPGRVGEILSQ